MTRFSTSIFPEVYGETVAALEGVRAIIFDMDGVLLDTERLSKRLWEEAFAEYGLELPEHVFKKCLGRTVPACLEIFSKEFGPDAPILEIDEKQEARYKEAVSKPIDLKPGVHEILSWARERGIPCAVGSSTAHEDVEATLEVNDLRKYFEAVVGGDYVEHGKPAPDIFLKAAEYLGMPVETCLVIEDSRHGLRAANAAGMPVIMVPDQLPATEVDSDIRFLECGSLLEVRDLLDTLLFQTSLLDLED